MHRPESESETPRTPYAPLRRLLWPALTLLILLIPGWPLLVQYGAEARALSERVIFWTVGTAIGFALAWLVVRLIEVLIWSPLERRFQAPIPRLLKDIIAGIIFLIAGITIVSLVFHQSVTGLWATSGLVGIVLGFALRNMIADVFSGIALNIDRSFKLGDWIEAHPRSVEPMRGCVTEINWRSTRIRTTSNTMVILPNSLVSSIVVVNLSAPETRSRFKLTFCLEFGIPTERALRVLTAGVKAAKGLLTDPAPTVFAHRVTETGVEYQVRYWIEPTVLSPRRARHRVTASILHHLYHAGISLAYPKQDLYLARLPLRQLDRARDKAELLRRVELFSQLQPEEIQALAQHCQDRRFCAGDVIVREGEPGNSLFILVEGLLEVHKTADIPGSLIKVEEIGPGDFFGEMSLLTGAPRSATVGAVTDVEIYEIRFETVDLLLSRRQELAEQLAAVVARRQQELRDASSLPPETQAAVQRTLTDQILDKMKAFFSGLAGKLHPQSNAPPSHQG